MPKNPCNLNKNKSFSNARNINSPASDKADLLSQVIVWMNAFLANLLQLQEEELNEFLFKILPCNDNNSKNLKRILEGNINSQDKDKTYQNICNTLNHNVNLTFLSQVFSWVRNVERMKSTNEKNQKNLNPNDNTFSSFQTLLTANNQDYSAFLQQLNQTIHYLRNDTDGSVLSDRFKELDIKIKAACSKKQIAPVIEFLDNFFDAVSKDEIFKKFLDQFGLKEGTPSTIFNFCQDIDLTTVPDVLNAPELKDPQGPRDVSPSRTSNSSSRSASNLSISNKTEQSSNSSFSSDKNDRSEEQVKLLKTIENNNDAISEVRQLLKQPYSTAIAVAKHLKEATDLPAFEETSLSKKAEKLCTSIKIEIAKLMQEEKVKADQAAAQLEQEKAATLAAAEQLKKEQEAAKAKAEEDARLLLLEQEKAAAAAAAQQAKEKAEQEKAMQAREEAYKYVKQKEKTKKDAAKNAQRAKEAAFHTLVQQVKTFMGEVIEKSSQSGCKLRRLSFAKSRKKLILQQICNDITQEKVTSEADLKKRLQAFIRASLMRRSSWRPWATHTTSGELCLKLLNGHKTDFNYAAGLIHILINKVLLRTSITDNLTYQNLATFTGVETVQDELNNNDGNQNQPSVIPLSYFSSRNKKEFYKAMLTKNNKLRPPKSR